MSPAIRDGEAVYVRRASHGDLRCGDIVLARGRHGFRLHRLVEVDAAADRFVTRGDCGTQDDEAVGAQQILGVAVRRDIRIGNRTMRLPLRSAMEKLISPATQGRMIARKLVRMSAGLIGQITARVSARETRLSVVALAVFFLAAHATAQVAVDASTNAHVDLTGAGNKVFTFNHNTTATANRLLIVGLSLDITNSSATAVTGVTYGASGLSLIGAHNDAGGTRRVEMWSLLNPASGANTISVTVNIPTAVSIGVVAGATTFTGVDQTVPLGTFVSADGAASACVADTATVASLCNSQLDVSSVVNGMVIDTLATGQNIAVTVDTPQVQQWNQNSGGNAAEDITGVGSTRTGAPSVPVAEWFTNATSNWAQGAVSVNPSVADIGVTTSVATVVVGQSTTYNITVFNNGTSAANLVTLSDTLAAGMTLGPVTPSAGVTCVTATNPITCTIGTLSSGATATVSVVETAATSGAFANTATVIDSGTPSDPNTGNNSFTAVATVQSNSCATISQASPGGTLTGVVNTYFPGTTSVAAGGKSITLGAATGAGTAIAAGNLLLVIQMQDASINTSNSVAYGNGSTGQGFSALNSAGDYEFVTATNAVPATGGTLNLTGSGTGGGLVFSYDSAIASGTKGQSTFQVILVPQYTTATLSSGLTASAWNGSTGGVLALDTSGALTLGGATISLDGLGFRGGAGLQLTGIPNPAPPTLPASTDFQQPAPATYTAPEAGWNGAKGEGIAGTPAWIETAGATPAPSSTGTGYPSGAAGQFTLTKAANSNGTTTVYTGTITGGGGNALAGYTFVVRGFTNPANNGRFVSTASSGTKLTLNNTAGVAETVAAGATANLDGSMGRGAPGNAGGGGTDADPQTATAGGNDQNTGGGGGGNGGAGGFGGDSWETNLSTGGEGGAAFPATVTRIAMGGGGGAGTRNNSNGDTQASSGAAGGGIIIIRADSLSGTATLSANGAAAYNGTLNDGGGGGGAGGSIVVLSANGGESGLTLNAKGGRGGDAWDIEPFSLGNRHGPGGGGGGGAVFVSGTPASVNVSGGANGLTETPGVSYGATAGAAGFSITNASIASVSGTQSGARCTPDMTLTKSHVGNFVRGSTASYTVTVSNVSPLAASTGTVTMSDTLPVGLTPTSASGTGWSCSIAAQTVSCVRSNSLPAGASYPSITINASVSQSAPSTVTNTATVSGGGEANLANDSATDVATVVSVSDMAIVKTASPNPVSEGATLTYTLTVTNGGPSSATNVTVTDTLPSSMTFQSAQTTAGTCSEAGSTVTCLLGTMTSGGSATVTILVIPGATGIISNTATVTADPTDPNLSNNSSTQTETVAASTAIHLHSFVGRAGTDKHGANRVVLTWKAGEEEHNLGFNVYREVAGNRVRLNPSLIAGSALQMSGALPKHSGKTYSWIDASALVPGAQYWLEDVSIGGFRQMHGPISIATAAAGDDSIGMTSPTLGQLNQSEPAWQPGQQSHRVEAVASVLTPTSLQVQKQFQLAANPAVKIQIKHEAWYQITQPQLVSAGLNANVDPATLHLYAEAIEQPIRVTGAAAGPGGFGPQAAISFYGTGMDTPYSGTRVYWLVAEQSPGARIRTLAASSGSNQPPRTFIDSVVLQQRTTYFGALLTTNGDNFFGSIVNSTPVEQVLSVQHLDTKSALEPQIEIVLQGVVAGIHHNVAVSLNGATIGSVTFTGQTKGTLRIKLPQGLLLEGNNTFTLAALGGDFDISLVDHIQISYPHLYLADSDALKLTGRAGEELTIGGFDTAPAAVVDITDPATPVSLTPTVSAANGHFQIALQVPWTTTSPLNPVQHTLLAVAGDRVAAPAGLISNHPSHWHSPAPGADIAMVTYDQFAGTLAPLVKAHKAESMSSAIVPVGDLYDEFNFGEHSPFVIRQFLQSATTNWTTKPKYLLLNGRASFDPRNFLGMGHLDLVPTRIIPASGLMTSSDDWFSDFNNSGVPTIATGRLPVSTLDEANLVVSKIAGYETSTASGAWMSKALIVADADDANDNFTQQSLNVQAKMPATLQITDIYSGTMGIDAARPQILSGINAGALIVNYLGHGSEEEWAGNMFDQTAAASLTNGFQLPVFLIMDCLNGYFQDANAQPLGVTLMLAPNGGGVAVLASSALNQAPPQARLDQLTVAGALNAPQLRLGDAILKAKAEISDPGTRKTYILFGDPAMRIKVPGSH
ncbi:MAG TPA: C25 family cysteine peptidase [Candidatus Sulfotelmatobacter sp.]|nr:C25 family cysteine peptidase [Candidatus Sulfotelmatobacter sp.]